MDVGTIYGNNVSYFGEVKTKAFDALGRLESLSLGYGTQLLKSFMGDLKLIDVGEFDKIDTGGLPTSAEVLASMRSIIPDAFPQAPSSDELQKYKKHVWESDQLDSIESTIMSYVDLSLIHI